MWQLLFLLLHTCMASSYINPYQVNLAPPIKSNAILIMQFRSCLISVISYLVNWSKYSLPSGRNPAMMQDTPHTDSINTRVPLRPILEYKKTSIKYWPSLNQHFLCKQLHACLRVNHYFSCHNVKAPRPCSRGVTTPYLCRRCDPAVLQHMYHKASAVIFELNFFLIAFI